MAYLEIGPRVGRSQGASIFWGFISVCFATAACFFYWKNHENERAANVMHYQVLELQEQNESLTSQKEHLQAAQSESESQLKTREDLVQDKETQLAAEEARIDSLGSQSQDQSQQNLAQAAAVKRFNDLIQKLGKGATPDVVERGGRPVLRLPNAVLFTPGTADLTPDGKSTLGQLAQGLGNQIDGFELRVVSYTDSTAESETVAAPANDADAKSTVPPSWALTEARASTLAHFFRDQTAIPFLNVLVQGRGDAEPIASNTGQNHARNRRVEIGITPMPVPFHPPEVDKSAATGSSSGKTLSAPAKDKPKPKAADKTDKPPAPAPTPAKRPGH